MIAMMIPNMATGLAAIALGAKGPSTAVATACAAGSNAIGDAFRLIQLGLADASLSELQQVCAFACQSGSDLHRLPFAVGPAELLAALVSTSAECVLS